ncbi:hypothetical protein VTL71DRAFT_13015 [Oculimacula yallundae]|uniref:Heterokaryon incompatibility domain-containing protein n=1 Tax=Oculimacula yallundae TaxID=86028 RepID=A0ABR4CP78_9HELO
MSFADWNLWKTPRLLYSCYVPCFVLQWHEGLNVQSVAIITQSTPLSPVQPTKAAQIDYRAIRHWLKICHELHVGRCDSARTEVPNLQVIDCENRAIVPASDHTYLTLSYLWGDVKDDSLFSEQLPESMPQTIEDALSVTLQLGFRYLWIDRYCINQQDKAETYTQLQSMGSIYRNSYLTIIATEGHNPSYGLPGVGRRHRQPFAEAKYDNQYFRSIPNPEAVVAYSKWNVRGWTYQEGILTRRRLVFTNEQVYFECHGMCCYESLNLPYQEMHSSVDHRLEPKYFQTSQRGTLDKLGVFAVGHGSKQTDIYAHIDEFSNRHLSYSSDRLKAFLGILEAFRIEYGVRHLWGIPILPDPQTRVLSVESFVLGLIWGARGFQTTAIPNLPTWSWVGWSGIIRYSSRFHDISNVSLVHVQLELLTGDKIHWDTYMDGYSSIDSAKLSRFLHISAWCVPLSSVSCAPSHWYEQWTCTAAMDDGSSLELKADFLTEEHSSQCYALMIKETSDSWFLLIVDKINEYEWRRVGSILVTSSGHGDFILIEAGKDVADSETYKPKNPQIQTRFRGQWWRHFAGLEKMTFRIG